MTLESNFTRKAKYLAPEDCQICKDHIFTLNHLEKEKGDNKLFGLIQHNFDRHLKAKHNINVAES
jgi:hypothetical protein